MKSKKIKLVVLLIACVALLALALTACSSQSSSSSSASSSTSSTSTSSSSSTATSTASSTASDNSFFNTSTGLYPETYANMLRNVGNRGCNSCHEDLLDVTRATVPTHIFTNTGYNEKLTFKVCEPCHSFQVGRAGVYLGDVIHTIHYGNSTFVDTDKGNCMNCHAYVSDGAGGYNLALFDDVKYDAEMWGYPKPADANTRFWVKSRGIGADGYLSGVLTEENPNISISFSQPASDEADNYVIDNWTSIDIPSGEAYYYQGATGTTTENYKWNNSNDYDYSSWSLEVKGVKNPRSFTLDDLKALPQTEYTATQICETTGVGTTLVSNIPVKGVKLQDIIDACGGLAQGTAADQQFFCVSLDSWTGEFFDGVSLQDLLDENAMVAIQYYGHDLTQLNGAPAVIVAPGMPGSEWNKHLQSIEFKYETDSSKVFNPFEKNAKVASLLPICSGFFQNDGVTGKVGEPLELSGYSWSWTSTSVGNVNKVSFSMDYGETWKDFNVPANFDPNQWAYWNYSWTPQRAGTYIIKVQASTDAGQTQSEPANIIVTVTE